MPGWTGGEGTSPASAEGFHPDGLVERIPSGEITELSLGLEGTLRDD